MNKYKFNSEIESIFNNEIEDIKNLKLVPKWIPEPMNGFPYYGFEEQLAEHFKKPWDSLIYWSVYKIKNDEDFFKTKSKKKKLQFFQNDIEIYPNFNSLYEEMFDVLRNISSSIEDELFLLKEDILTKYDVFNIDDFRENIIKKINEFKPASRRVLSYIQNENPAIKYPYDDLHDFGFVDLFEGRFNFIAGVSLFNTKAYYGLDEYVRVGEEEVFHNPKSFKVEKEEWLELERLYTFNKLYKKILKAINDNISPTNFLNSTTISIFQRNCANILHEVLCNTNAIDENKNPVRGKFQPICQAFYTLNSDRTYSLFKQTTTLKEFIEYLNRPDTYNAELKNFSKLSSGQNHYNSIKEMIKTEMDKQSN